MHQEKLFAAGPDARVEVPVAFVHTLVLGSGAAGLAAAVQLRGQGIDDVLVVTEGLDLGTSINTGSDKQTYYKLSLCGRDADAPAILAESYFAGGSMHGDLALVEAALSARAFLHLVDLGVPFPRDAFGQFVGYKTDHDPRQRATSIGPYTSREMCRALIRRLEELAVPVWEGRLAVELLALDNPDGTSPQYGRRAAGAVLVDNRGRVEVVAAENVVFAVGGPGGLYRASVYPHVHTGAVGLALRAGAQAQNLPDSQYGLASIGFRWNVSGTYMQVVPRFVSTAADGSDPREFLGEYFEAPGAMHSRVFLKGYQWPFDARKLVGGSSLVDLLVYIETVLRGRRVWLDFRRNPDGFRFDALSDEARDYLTRSGALQETPLARLRAMNPGAVALYADQGIDLAAEMLEIAVCAQHNNGGLAGNLWWESVNVEHLFPIGEVNGSHGVYRPGGSALNAGQVGAMRAAEYIAARYREATLDHRAFCDAAASAAAGLLGWLDRAAESPAAWQAERDELQERMSRCGAHIRSAAELAAATGEAWRQWQRIEAQGCRFTDARGRIEALKNRHLAYAAAVYLDAIRFAVASGVGSRGSAVVLDPAGTPIHPQLDATWRIAAGDEAFREKVLTTLALPQGGAEHTWIDRRPIPATEPWFETAWAAWRSGEVYDA